MSSLLMIDVQLHIAPDEKTSSQILYNPHTYLHHGHTMVVALQSNRCHVTMITMIKEIE